MRSDIADMIAAVKKGTGKGIVSTVKELKENQFGLPLQHYAQQYLFGATGLRLRVFHSISGAPQSCKSPLLFDLMGHICADKEHGGLGGFGYLYEMEDKISPTLLQGVLSQHGETAVESVIVMEDMTIDDAFESIGTKVIPYYKKMLSDYTTPLVLGLDSIGGAAAKDTLQKMASEGAVGKGFHEKSHYVKYFCENAGVAFGDVPVVVICINQEKEAAAATPYGPPQKTVTGGKSQIFKDGHMISSSFKTLATGDGKLLTLRTTKTSFSDARKIEVAFRWNKFGAVGDDKDTYGHHFDWAMATAKCIADPEKGVGDIRDICNVKVAESGLVTCETFGLRSVPAEEFEAALFDSSNSKVLNDLYAYQKIERIKDMDDYAEYMKKRKSDVKTAKEESKEEKAPKATVTKKTAAKRKPTPLTLPADEPPKEEENA